MLYYDSDRFFQDIKKTNKLVFRHLIRIILCSAKLVINIYYQMLPTDIFSYFTISRPLQDSGHAQARINAAKTAFPPSSAGLPVIII